MSSSDCLAGHVSIGSGGKNVEIDVEGMRSCAYALALVCIRGSDVTAWSLSGILSMIANSFVRDSGGAGLPLSTALFLCNDFGYF